MTAGLTAKRLPLVSALPESLSEYIARTKGSMNVRICVKLFRQWQVPFHDVT